MIGEEVSYLLFKRPPGKPRPLAISTITSLYIYIYIINAAKKEKVAIYSDYYALLKAIKNRC